MQGRISGRELVAQVDEGFRTLPDRYLGADPGFDATYRIRLGDVGRSWELRATPEALRVRCGLTRRPPDVTIDTDAETWLELRAGTQSGLQAFSRRRLHARGNLDLAIALEGLLRLPNGRDPLLRLRDVDVDGLRISTLTMGSGPDVLLVHGLGGTKASFFETAAELSTDYRVHAIDLPGFGSSSKPATAPYDAGYFAGAVLGTMDALGVDRAHLVGNSLGGRVAIEVALRAPHRVGALGLLCPAVAFLRRGWHPLVRTLRPEFGLLPHRFTRAAVERQFFGLFCDRDLVDPELAELVVDEFQRIYGSAGARYAFLAAARNVYLDRPFGRGGFYPRLAELEPPALFIWSRADRLIPCAFARHVEEWLPGAQQVILEACGHVPQVESPDQTHALLRGLLERADRRPGRRGSRRRVAA